MQPDQTPAQQSQNIMGSPNPRLIGLRQFESPIELVSQRFRNSFSNETEKSYSNHSNKSQGSLWNKGNSPEQQLKIKHTRSIKNIIEKQNEDSDYDCQQRSYHENEEQLHQIDRQHYQMPHSPENIDVLGNLLPIGQFEVQDRFDSQYYPETESFLPEIIEDKENEIPVYASSTSSMHLYTPLKNKQNSIRSPLRDITPTLTKKKKKSAHTTNASEKSFLLTPRTLPLTESRLSGSGFRRMERL